MSDGAINMNGSGVDAALVTPKGSHVPFVARLTVECTDSVAEYEAGIRGIEPRCVHTGATPRSLVYGIEVVLPTEV